MEILRKLRDAVGLSPRPALADLVLWPDPLRQLRRYLIKGNPALASGRQWVWYRKEMKRRGVDLKLMARTMAVDVRTKR